MPFVSKATGVPLAQAAALVMVGQDARRAGHHRRSSSPTHFSVKESVFPFNKFPGVDIILGPEMRSTGEVMGIDTDFAVAFAKSQLAASSRLPMSGTVFVSVADRDRKAIVPVAAPAGRDGLHADVHRRDRAGALPSTASRRRPSARSTKGRPNLLDHLANGDIALIVNTPSGKGARTDEGRIRAAAVSHGVPCITTVAGARAAVAALERLRTGDLNVYALQDLLK